jgi:SIR2-like domain
MNQPLTGAPKITLLVGAGFARSAGLPTSVELAQRFNGYIDKRAKAKGPMLLKFLHFYLEGGIRLQRGKAGRDPSTSVNIEEIAVAARCLHAREQSPLAPFVSGWHPHLHEMLTNEPKLLETYLDCFNDHLREELKVPEAEKIAWIDRLAEIACDFSTLDIFSLNYDCCIERAFAPYCRDHGDVDFVDGFDENGWKPDLFKETGSSKKIVRLYKVHGSLDWVDSEEYGLVSLAKAPRNIVEDLIGLEPHLVFGTDVKLTGEQPFFTMAHLFYENLVKSNALVVIGYSFGDAYINALISQCQRQNPKLRLLIIDKFATQLRENSGFLKTVQIDHPVEKGADEAIANHGLRKILKQLVSADSKPPF